MAQPRNPNSLRSILSCLLLNCFSRGSHGPTAEVIAEVPKFKNGNLRVKKSKMEVEKTDRKEYNENTLKVQVAQCRVHLLGKIGIALPFEVRGRMTEEQKAILDKKLNHASYKAKAQELLKEYAKAA